MSSNAKLGYGTLIGYSTVGANTYTNIAEIIDCPSPEETVPKVDVSNYDSPLDSASNPVEEFIPGWVSPGENKVKANFLVSNVVAIRALLRKVKDWKITLLDGTTIKFTGYISRFGVMIPLKDRVTQEWGIQASGSVVYTAGS